MKLPGIIVATIKQRTPREWEAMFDQMVTEKAAQIEGTADSELPKLKAEIKAIREIKNSFLASLQE